MDPVNECYKFISSCEEPATFDLITAASVGDMRLVQSFLRKSVNPNITNTSGWTSLMYAANYGHYNVVRLLIECGADVNLQEWVYGRTALMFAANNGHTRCVEILVTYGKAFIELTDHSGKTAAYYATHFGHGNNKIIGKLLKITDSRNNPRRITKTATPRPEIVITQSDGSVKAQNNDLAIRRKRKLLNDSDAVGPQQVLSPSKSGSPPLPTSLDELLNRLDLEDYIPMFSDSAVDLYIFLTLTDKDLKELGISSIGHRRRLTAAQQRFRESIEIRNAQEKFFADWLLNEREQMKLELEALRTANSDLNCKLQELQSKNLRLI
ncbi:Ankyrin repeat and SAM domain-containing protein 3-like protein [Leptotrombidium deliense]|uniref:Ankyrin repeat and SAM domain-containing protein 3-like protein n=1 Tax=Leptotrombidium deliense TaxID=299467 RepID=A0A443SD31_9ACAR|nr:Ankyrin repeat and SAM domain-containing protein 3-like protein [Leptotrombidium deliense]